MATLSADNRLRNKVCAGEGTVILIGAGHVDRVIRFTVLPDCLKSFMTEVEGKMVYPVKINLDRGPDQEAWSAALRDAGARARRDKPMPSPLEVSAAHNEGWAVDDEDVPVIEYDATVPVAASELKCGTCTVEFKTTNGLRIHQARTKHS